MGKKQRTIKNIPSSQSRNKKSRKQTTQPIVNTQPANPVQPIVGTQPANPVQPIQPAALLQGVPGLQGQAPINPQWGAPIQPQTFDKTKRLTPAERMEMIKEVYTATLGREPTTRDINYYKYSTLQREQIQDKLIISEEHSNLIKKGSKYDKVQNQLTTTSTRTQALEGQIRDQLEEFKSLMHLLKEKNRCIEQLREHKTNRYAIPSNITQTQGTQVPTQVPQPVNRPTKPVLPKPNIRKSWSEKIRYILGI